MTQGVLSVVQNGKVRLKVVAGCDGARVIGLAARIRELGQLPTIEEVYAMACVIGLGSVQSLVVMNETEMKYEGDGQVGELYRKTFNLPDFNPRWEQGMADYVEIVNLGGA